MAEAIDSYLAIAEVADATGRRNRGLLAGADLAAWRPGVEDPVALEYRGLRVHKPGPWSQGPVFLQQLSLLEPMDLAGAGRGSAEHMQAAVEAVTFHTDHVPSSFTPRRARPLALVAEAGLDPAVLDELRRRGHEMELAAPYSLGKVCATGFAPDAMVWAAASPRGQQAQAGAL